MATDPFECPECSFITIIPARRGLCDYKARTPDEKKAGKSGKAYQPRLARKGPILPILVLFLNIILFACNENKDVSEPFASAKGNLPQVVWQKCFDGEVKDYATTLVVLPDDGMIVAGITRSYGAGRKSIVRRLDKDGTELWIRILGIGSNDSMYASTLLSDGSIVLSGRTNRDYSETSSDGWVTRVDASGNVIWDKTYDFSGKYDSFNRIINLPNNKLAILGDCEDKDSNNYPWIVVIDENGNVINQKAYVEYKKYTLYNASINKNEIQCVVKSTSSNTESQLISINIENLEYMVLNEADKIKLLFSKNDNTRVIGINTKEFEYYIASLKNISQKNIIKNLPPNTEIMNLFGFEQSYIISGLIKMGQEYHGMIAVIDSQGKVDWQLTSPLFTAIAISQCGNGDIIIAGAQKNMAGDDSFAMWIARIRQ